VRARAAATLLGGATSVDTAPPWWGRYPFVPGTVGLKLVAPVAALHAVLYALRDGAGVPVAVRGSPAVGEAYAALPGDLPFERVEATLAAVRVALAGRGGSCTVLTAPATVRASVDLWGEVDEWTVARQTKRQLDPRGTFPPRAGDDAG
jgi:glycolate oxidase FAD binding subunit